MQGAFIKVWIGAQRRATRIIWIDPTMGAKNIRTDRFHCVKLSLLFKIIFRTVGIFLRLIFVNRRAIIKRFCTSQHS